MNDIEPSVNSFCTKKVYIHNEDKESRNFWNNTSTVEKASPSALIDIS